MLWDDSGPPQEQVAVLLSHFNNAGGGPLAEDYFIRAADRSFVDNYAHRDRGTGDSRVPRPFGSHGFE
jgi:hypothetical protein